MNRKVVFVVGVLILLSFVSAGLVGYLSNVVTGTVQVSGPVFYLSPDKTLVNGEPTGEQVFVLNSETIIFESEALDIDTLYAAYFNVYVRVQENGGSNSINVEVVKINSVGGDSNICGPEVISITNPSNFNEKSVVCSSDSVSFDIGDKIGIKISGVGKVKVYPYTTEHGYPHVEVSPV